MDALCDVLTGLVTQSIFFLKKLRNVYESLVYLVPYMGLDLTSSAILMRIINCEIRCYDCYLITQRCECNTEKPKPIKQWNHDLWHSHKAVICARLSWCLLIDSECFVCTWADCRVDDSGLLFSMCEVRILEVIGLPIAMSQDEVRRRPKDGPGIWVSVTNTGLDRKLQRIILNTSCNGHLSDCCFRAKFVYLSTTNAEYKLPDWMESTNCIFRPIYCTDFAKIQSRLLNVLLLISTSVPYSCSSQHANHSSVYLRNLHLC